MSEGICDWGLRLISRCEAFLVVLLSVIARTLFVPDERHDSLLSSCHVVFGSRWEKVSERCLVSFFLEVSHHPYCVFVRKLIISGSKQGGIDNTFSALDCFIKLLLCAETVSQPEVRLSY